MTNIETDIWHWYHNVSQCHYHIQLTIKYRMALFNPNTEKAIVDSLKNVKEKYAIEIYNIGFDQNHVHILTQFLPKYSGGQVIKLIKSISTKAVFTQCPEIKKKMEITEKSLKKILGVQEKKFVKHNNELVIEIKRHNDVLYEKFRNDVKI